MSQQPLEVLNQTFESRAVRVVMKDGDPWFIAKDVAEALGYKKPENAVAQHCEEAVNLPPVSGDSLDSRLKIIPESDVYALIFRSKLESAKCFRRWVANALYQEGLIDHCKKTVVQGALIANRGWRDRQLALLGITDNCKTFATERKSVPSGSNHTGHHTTNL